MSLRRVRLIRAILAGSLGFGMLVLAACAGAGGGPGGKVLVTDGAYRLLNSNSQATAVFAQDAHKAPDAELICERVLLGKRVRTLCYARFEEADRVRDHQEKWHKMTTVPGSGG